MKERMEGEIVEGTKKVSMAAPIGGKECIAVQTKDMLERDRETIHASMEGEVVDEINEIFLVAGHAVEYSRASEGGDGVNQREDEGRH